MPKIDDDFNSFLKRADTVCDYIPVVSTVTNLVDLFQKCVLSFTNPTKIEKDRYYSHLKDKSTKRCLLLLLPGVVNLAVGIYDFSHRKKKKREKTIEQAWKEKSWKAERENAKNESMNSMLEKIRNQPSVVKKASPDFKNNQHFMLKACEIEIRCIEHASPALKNNEKFMVKACKLSSLALDHASENLKKDRNFLIKAFAANGFILNKFSKELLEDKDFMVKIYRKNPDYFTLQNPNRLMDDEEFKIKLKEKTPENLNP